MKKTYHSNNLKKHMAIFIIIYVIAFAINIIGALWYPDYNLSQLNFIASIVFTIGLGLIIIKLIHFNKTKWMLILLHIGFLSGILNYFAYRNLGMLRRESSSFQWGDESLYFFKKLLHI